MKKAFNFISAIVCVLVLIMCLMAFVACDKNKQDDLSGLENAKSQVYQMYKKLDGSTQTSDFYLVNAIVQGETRYTVEWTYNVTAGPENSVSIVESDKEGNVKFSINVYATEDTTFVVRGIIRDDAGHQLTIAENGFTITIPKYQVADYATIKQACDDNSKDTYTFIGYIVGVNAAPKSGTVGSLWIMDDQGHGLYVYNNAKDPSKNMLPSTLTTREAINEYYPVGAQVLVKGTVALSYGVYQFGAQSNVTLTGKTAQSENVTLNYVDRTQLFGNATDNTDKSLVETQCTMISLANVILGEKNGKEFTFYVNDKEFIFYNDQYLIDETTVSAISDKWVVGAKANLKGIVNYYNKYQVYPNSIDSVEILTQTDEELVNSVLATLTLDQSVKANFTLPTNATVDSVEWKVKSGTAAVIGENSLVTITRGDEDAEVVFTVTVKKGDVTKSKDITVVVKAKDNYVVGVKGEPNVAYKLMVTQENLSKDLFLTGAMSGYYFATSEDVADAIDVYVEVVTEDTYRLFIQNGDDAATKKYIEIIQSGNYTNVKFNATATDGVVWTWDAAKETYTIVIGSKTYAIGSYNTFNTLSACDTSKSSFYAKLYQNVVVKSDADKVAEAKEALELAVTTTAVSFTLPITGANGAVITWESSNTDVIAINGEDAVVTAPAADTLVKLTATIKIGEAQDTKEFDVTITATIPEFDVTITQPAAGGTVEVKKGADVIATGKVQQGTVLTITATPQDAQHELVAIKVNGKAIEAVDGVYSVNVTEAVEITAEFKEIKNVTVTIAAVENGKVEVKKGADAVENNAVLRDGDVLTITATANAGYKVSAIKVNGEAIKGNTYTITGAEADGKVAITVETVEYTQADIVNDAWALEENTTLGTFTLTGVIKSIDTPYDSGFGNLTVSIIVDGLTEKPMICFRMKGTGAESLMVNDTITVTGTIKNYNGKVEFDSGCTFKDRVVGTSTVSVDANSSKNATVTLEDGMTSGLNGATFTFTVSVSDGHELVSVKVNGVEVNAVENIYTGTINGNTIVSVETKEVGAADPVVVATFEFPTSGKTGHQDGSSVTSYTDTNNSYTLSITDGSSFYTKANDAKGNGCLKLGTGKKTGSFTLTAPENVKFVVLYVAGYKANTASITFNGTKYDVSTASNNGEYTAIKVAVPENKTIAFESGASGDKRCMINKIEFMA